VRDEARRPVALRLRVMREHRSGAAEVVSVLVHLDERARAAVAEADRPNASPDAPLGDAAPHLLEIDPRVQLGGDSRLGRVREPGVTLETCRAWYGVRRIATDEAPRYTSDRRVLDKLGGWTPGSPTREGEYQNHQNELLIAETAAVRRAWRTGASDGAEGV